MRIRALQDGEFFTRHGFGDFLARKRYLRHMALFKRGGDATIPPGQHVTDGFPVLHVGDVPQFDRERWRLRFYGLCEHPFELSFDELLALPAAEWRGDIHCVTRWSKKDTHWKGVM